MKTFTKNISRIGGALAASALIASMMIAPAFAADPTHRSSTGQYTETVAYDSSVTTASTEVLIDTKFHYLDYSPEIDVTYSWDEDLEWTYVKNGSLAPGFWVKGGNVESAWNYVVDFYGNTISSLTGRFSDPNLPQYRWEQFQERFNEDAQGSTRLTPQFLCYPIKFVNNAANELYLSLEEQSASLNTVTIDSKTYSATSYTAKSYLEYRNMAPLVTTGTESDPVWQWPEKYATQGIGGYVEYAANEQGDVKLTQSVVIGNDTTPDTTRRNMPHNEYVVGVSPRKSFTPSGDTAWIAENRVSNHSLAAQLKIIFTKKEA